MPTTATVTRPSSTSATLTQQRGIREGEVPGSTDGIEEPIGRTVGGCLTTSFHPDNRESARLADHASDRVLDSEISCRHQIAVTLGEDVRFATTTTSHDEGTLDSLDGEEGLLTDHDMGAGHPEHSVG